jgi:hypothetical protein
MGGQNKIECQAMNQECEGCFYFKVRDVDSETGALAWGLFCLKAGQPVRCEVAILECDNE